MRKFWGYYSNGKYSVGCSGGSVYVFDSNGNEIKRFKDFPYAYYAAFMPGRNIIAVKTTGGHLGFYDLDTLSLIKKHTITTIGSQDDGFVFSPDGRYFYNIERPVYSTETQLGIYETGSFSKIHSLFSDNKIMELCYIETDAETGRYYVLGFMRDENKGWSDYDYVGIFDPDKLEIISIIRIDEDEYWYLEGYKSWEKSGFTEKAFEYSWALNKPASISDVRKTSIKEVFEKYAGTK